MKKLALVLLSLAMTAGMTAPAFASSSDNSPLSKVVQVYLFPVRVVAAGVGCVVGIPVAAVRDTYTQYVSMTTTCADKVGGHECGPSCLGVSLVTVPAAILIGSARGVYYGGYNGIMGYNAPYAPSSFSVTKEYESTTTTK